MINYLDNPEINKPGAEEIQPRDFLYRDLRDKHPELEEVSKREYAYNKQLQEELEGERLDGKTWRDDYDFDEEINTSQLSNDSLIEKEGMINSEQENHLSYGGEDSTSNNENRLTEFKGGGTHEQNSLGGIPLGIGPNGKRNSVEEGETRYNFDEGGYIFSNRIDTTGLFQDAKNARNESTITGEEFKKKSKQGSREFTEEYINSPKYKEKLKRSGYPMPDEVIKYRSERVEDSNVVEQDGPPGLMKQIFNKITSTPYSYTGSQYHPKENTLVIDQKEDRKRKVFLSKEGTKAHEYAHSELSGVGLNKKDFDSLFDRQKVYNDPDDVTLPSELPKIKQRVMKNPASHNLKPEENKADLNALRFLLNEEGIYDARKEEFTKQHLKKLKSNFIKDRLLRNYSEKDLIWLMNNIALNDNKENYNVT